CQKFSTGVLITFPKKASVLWCILNCFSITLQKVNPKSRTMPFTPEELYKFQQLSTAGKDAEIAELRMELDCLR
ncbi:MAG: hypothetical protein IJA00_09500, partial [Bacteroidaceae bacterium]|nr:hypothetical protein [Bacteroidaceae bacterium]